MLPPAPATRPRAAAEPKARTAAEREAGCPAPPPESAAQSKAKPREAHRQDLRVDGFEAGLLEQLKWIQRVPEAPTYRPSAAEFENPIAYIRSIEPKASKTGVCKIIPPPNFVRSLTLDEDFEFTVRQQKLREHQWDDFGPNDLLFDLDRTYTVAQFRERALLFSQREIGTNSRIPTNVLEAEYWRLRKDMTRTLYVEYGNDLEGTAFSRPSKRKGAKRGLSDTRWNLGVLGKDKGSLLKHVTGELPGITSPMLYIGSAFAAFFWHVEDHYMHSINYMHGGSAKTWYGVPSRGADAFEKAAFERVFKRAMDGLRALGKSEAEVTAAAKRFLLRKTTMFTVKHLVDAGVPVFRAVQNAGEFVVTFPRAYHGGFSHGFNVGEAVNFAIPDWFPLGRKALERYCDISANHIIPHEELLCREAVALGEVLCRKKKAKPAPHQQIMMREFINFMERHRRSTQRFKKAGAQAKSTTFPCGSIKCSQCGRGCYLSLVYAPGLDRPLCIACAHAKAECQVVKAVAMRLYTRAELPIFYRVAGSFISTLVKCERTAPSRAPDGLMNSRRAKRRKLTQHGDAKPAAQRQPQAHKPTKDKHTVTCPQEQVTEHATRKRPLEGPATAACPQPTEAGTSTCSQVCRGQGKRRRAAAGQDAGVEDVWVNTKEDPLEEVGRSQGRGVDGRRFPRRVLAKRGRPEECYLLASEVLKATGKVKGEEQDGQAALREQLELWPHFSIMYSDPPMPRVRWAYVSDSPGEAAKGVVVLSSVEAEVLSTIYCGKDFLALADFVSDVYPDWTLLLHRRVVV
ncbi:unnamed protein product [Ostreobium quekettii]|uniref:Uncharacterized protein n=1 Tax=Ostreobium quekettii TaxID=121088 RepID=A0A8S1J182_9CHLO|nr:unnamed protein product [Ostreobium quekettii]